MSWQVKGGGSPVSDGGARGAAPPRGETAFEEPLGEVVMEPFGGQGEGLGEVGQSGWQPQEREHQQGVWGGALEFL